MTRAAHCCLGPQHERSSEEQSLWQPRRGACHGRPRGSQGPAHATAPIAPCQTPWLLLQLAAALPPHCLRQGCLPAPQLPAGAVSGLVAVQQGGGGPDRRRVPQPIWHGSLGSAALPWMRLAEQPHLPLGPASTARQGQSPSSRIAPAAFAGLASGAGSCTGTASIAERRNLALHHCLPMSGRKARDPGHLGNLQHANRGSLVAACVWQVLRRPPARHAHCACFTAQTTAPRTQAEIWLASPVSQVLCESGALCTPHLSPFSLKVPTSTSTTWPTWAQSASAQDR